MPYLIDGHNLIGQLPDIDLDDPNDEALLVQKLAGFVARTRQKCVVVFDHGIPGGKSRMSTKGVEVLFASHPGDADQMIIKRIEKLKNPKAWTVVSSDHQVQNKAKLRNVGVIKSNEFAKRLKRQKPAPKPGLDEAHDIHLSEEELEEWMQIFEGKL